MLYQLYQMENETKHFGRQVVWPHKFGFYGRVMKQVNEIHIYGRISLILIESIKRIRHSSFRLLTPSRLVRKCILKFRLGVGRKQKNSRRVRCWGTCIAILNNEMAGAYQKMRAVKFAAYPLPPCMLGGRISTLPSRIYWRHRKACAPMERTTKMTLFKSAPTATVCCTNYAPGGQIGAIAKQSCTNKKCNRGNYVRI